MSAGERTFGERLRALRKRRGMTQKQLADKAGISENFVGRMETENRQPRRDRLMALAGALGVSPNELLGPSPLADAPDPWAVALSERLDELPVAFADQARRLISELVGLFAAPLLMSAALLADLVGETSELSEAEMQQVAEYALRLAHQRTASEGEPGADAARVSGE